MPLRLLEQNLPSFLALFAFSVFAVAIIFAALRSLADAPAGEKDRRYLTTVVLIGLAVRILLASALRITGLNETIAPDEGTFHQNAVFFSQWLSGDVPYRFGYRFHETLQVGYFYLVGTIYHVFGVVEFLPVLLNCVVGALTAVPVYRIAEQLSGRDAARPAAVLATFFPSVLLWSTLLIRDTLVIFLLCWIILQQMRLARDFKLRRLVVLVILMLAMGTLRQYLFLIVAVSVAGSLLLGRRGSTGRSLAAGAVAVVLLAMVMKLSGFGVWEMERASLANLNMQRRYNTSTAQAAGSLRPEVDISEPAGAIAYLPVGIVYFLCSPFPWQVLGGRQIIGLPDVILFYLLIPSILVGLVWTVRHRLREASMLLMTTITITVLYSLVEGNVGIIFRHRAQVLVPLMIIAGIGISVRRKRREEEEANA